MNFRGALSTIALTLIAVALTVTTAVLAPLPLMLLRRNGGRVSFFVGAILASSALIWLSNPVTVTLFLAACILTFVFCECESQNIGYSSSGFVTVLVICGFAALATGFAIQQYGFEPVDFFRGQVNLLLSQLTLPAGVSIDREALIRQVPSVLFIVIVFSIWINSVLVPRFEGILGWVPTAQAHVFTGEELRSWKLPDSFIWLALAAIAGSYFDAKPEWLKPAATNVLNVVVMLYFFQGLAIIVDFFVVKRVSSFWRVLSYIFIFSQLIPMVSVLGFLDLWLSFRERMRSGNSAVA